MAQQIFQCPDRAAKAHIPDLGLWKRLGEVSTEISTTIDMNERRAVLG